MSDGFRFKGKNFRSEKELDALPEQYRAQWEQGKRSVDPGFESPDLAPNAGRVIVPHVATFSGIVSTLAKTYKNPDEAIRHSVANAAMMRRDPMVMGPLLARQQAVALLDWSIEPEDKTNSEQVEVAKLLENMIAAIPNFVKYRRNLLEAIWYGRYGIQHRWGFSRTSRGSKVTAVRSWVPVNGDKILFRYEDYTGKYDHDEIGIKVSPAHVKNDIIAGRQDLEWNTEGSAVFLRRWERARIALHKHLIMDGDYEDPTTGGMVHGVGIRHFIYWMWFQKQETMAQLAELVDRSGMGFTIYRYPAGDDQAKQEMLDIANKQATANQIVMPHDPMNPAYGIEQIPPNTQGVTALMELIDGYFGAWVIRFILGQTSTVRAEPSGLGGGQSDLHRESFVQIVRYDAENLDDTLTRDLVQRYVEFNFPSMKHVSFKFRSHVPDPNVNEKLAGLQAAWTMGAKIKANDIMSLVGLTLAGEDDVALYNPDLQASIMQLEQQGGVAVDPEAAEDMEEEGGEEGDILDDLDSLQALADSMNYNLQGEKERYAAEEPVPQKGLVSETSPEIETSPQKVAAESPSVTKQESTAAKSVPDETPAKKAANSAQKEAAPGERTEGDKALQAEPEVPETVGQDLKVATEEEAGKVVEESDKQDLGGLEEGDTSLEGDDKPASLIGSALAGSVSFEKVIGNRGDTTGNHLKGLFDNLSGLTKYTDRKQIKPYENVKKDFKEWAERKRSESPSEGLEKDLANYERIIEGMDHQLADYVVNNFDKLFDLKELEQSAMRKRMDFTQVKSQLDQVKSKFTEQLSKLNDKHGSVTGSVEQARTDELLSEEKQLKLGEEMFSDPSVQSKAQKEARDRVVQATFGEITGKDAEKPGVNAEEVSQIPPPPGIREEMYGNLLGMMEMNEKTVKEYVDGTKKQVPEGRAAKLWDVVKVAADALTSTDEGSRANAKLMLEQQSIQEIAAAERILGRDLSRFYDREKVSMYPSQATAVAAEGLAAEILGEDTYISHTSLMNFIAPKLSKGQMPTNEDWALAIEDNNEYALEEGDKIDPSIIGRDSSQSVEGQKVDEELTGAAITGDDAVTPAGKEEGLAPVEGEGAVVQDEEEGPVVDAEVTEENYQETLDLVQEYVNDPANEYTDDQIESANRISNQEDLERVISDLGIKFEDVPEEEEDLGSDDGGEEPPAIEEAPSGPEFKFNKKYFSEQSNEDIIEYARKSTSFLGHKNYEFRNPEWIEWAKKNIMPQYEDGQAALDSGEEREVENWIRREFPHKMEWVGHKPKGMPPIWLEGFEEPEARRDHVLRAIGLIPEEEIRKLPQPLRPGTPPGETGAKTGEDATPPVAEKRKQLRTHKGLNDELEGKGIEKPGNWDSLKVAEKNEFLNNLESEAESEGEVTDEDEGDSVDTGGDSGADSVDDANAVTDVDSAPGSEPVSVQDESDEEDEDPEALDGTGEEEDSDATEDDPTDTTEVAPPEGDTKETVETDDSEEEVKVVEGESDDDSETGDGEVVSHTKESLEGKKKAELQEIAKGLGVTFTKRTTVETLKSKIIEAGASTDETEDESGVEGKSQPVVDAGESTTEPTEPTEPATETVPSDEVKTPDPTQGEGVAPAGQEPDAEAKQPAKPQADAKKPLPKIAGDETPAQKAYIESFMSGKGVVHQVLTNNVDEEAAIDEAIEKAGLEPGSEDAEDFKNLHLATIRAARLSQRQYAKLFKGKPKVLPSGVIDQGSVEPNQPFISSAVNYIKGLDSDKRALYGKSWVNMSDQEFDDLADRIEKNPETARRIATALVKNESINTLNVLRKDGYLDDSDVDKITDALYPEGADVGASPAMNVPFEFVEKQAQKRFEDYQKLSPMFTMLGFGQSDLKEAKNAMAKFADLSPEELRKVQDKMESAHERARGHLRNALSSAGGRELGIDPDAPLREQVKGLNEYIGRAETLTDPLKGKVDENTWREIEKGGPQAVVKSVEAWQEAALSKGWKQDPDRSEIENFVSAFDYMNEDLPAAQRKDALIAVFAGMAIFAGLAALGAFFKWLMGEGKK